MLQYLAYCLENEQNQDGDNAKSAVCHIGVAFAPFRVVATVTCLIESVWFIVRAHIFDTDVLVRFSTDHTDCLGIFLGNETTSQFSPRTVDLVFPHI